MFIPRNYIRLSAISMLLAVALCGCDSGHDDSKATPEVKGNIDLGKLDVTETATIALDYYPGEDDSDQATIALSNGKIGDIASAEELITAKDTSNDIPNGKCALTTLKERDRHIMAKFKSDCLAKSIDARTAFKKNTVYTDLAEGETTNINVAVSYKTNITVQKMHSNSDTDSVIVFAEVVGGNPIIEKDKALEIDDYFGSYNPYDEAGTPIGARVREYFGDEWKVNGGIDGTEKLVIILLSPKTLGTPGLYGYCTAQDSIPYSSSNEYGNEGEILYINSTLGTFDTYSTIAHEFQHLCDYNQKFIHNGAFDGIDFELDGINEGKSQLAEDITGFSLAPAGGKPGNSFLGNAINAYMDDPSEVSSVDFSNTTAEYGKGYLTMRYIADRFGMSVVNKISTSPNVGFENIADNTKISTPNLLNGMNIACTGLKSLPKDLSFSSLILDNVYTVDDGQGNGTPMTVNSIHGDKIKANSFHSGKVTLSPNTSTVLYIVGDGSQVNINYSLPQNCVGQVIISDDSKYVTKYSMK